MTQLELARRGDVTPEMSAAAQREGVDPALVRKEVASGRAILPANPLHRRLCPIVIGEAFRCKVNANLGSSSVRSGGSGELDKLEAALQAGADTIMDLSTGGDIDWSLRRMVAASSAPLGTVPVYQALERAGSPEDITVDLLLDVIRSHAETGVDFMTVHAGLLREHLPLTQGRLIGMVSRGGAVLARWMRTHGRQNPLYERFDDICDIFREHDVSFSLGDGLRPGCLADASDEAQFAELRTLGELTLRARERGVQVMVEGPGHIPLDQIAMNVRKERELCCGAPFYVLGPLVTDIAAGRDHIASAIGGAVAAFHGTALLCYVTPAEHIGLPDADDVRRGVMAHRIAAHAADVARGRPGAGDRDDRMSRARRDFDWRAQMELALDREEFCRVRKRTSDLAEDARFCTMCGPGFCSMAVSRSLKKKVRP